MSTPAKRGLIGAIKAGQSHLGWDDATYRAVLARLCNGKTSSTKCSLEELQAVREYMHDQGFPRQSARNGKRPNVARSRKTMLSKVEALLADAKRPWNYAEKMCDHMFQVKRVEWLTTEQLTKLMQALAIDAKRRKKRETTDESATGNRATAPGSYSYS
ncbi:gp16 family protein [Klebsiella pneumoniae]|uniref:gp16 family protein n=1 Tax=Klebsiella pneumoniae TaxID=573 RepID=UPI001F1FBA67|nr:regulatory protein GemA [Klebsiella pneumoniae]